MIKRSCMGAIILFLLLLSACKPSPKIVPLVPGPGSEEVTSSGEDITTSTPLVAVLPTPTEPGRALTEEDQYVYEQNERLGRGIVVIPFSFDDEDDDETETVDVQSMLSAIAIESQHIRAIKDAGFDSVILPISWSYFAKEEPPYDLDGIFLDLIQQLVEDITAEGLNAVLYFDDYPELNDEPRVHTRRFLTIWEQIANHFKGFGDDLFFGIYMNPQGTFGNTTWNDTAIEAIELIRKTNPERTLMLGADFFSPNFLPGFKLPEDDRNLIITFSYFQPFQFTVQGLNNYLDQFIGTTWDGTEEEIENLNSTMETVAKYSRNNARPISLTSFGVSNLADDASRAKWLNAVARAAEGRDFSWFYLGMANTSEENFPFGIYDFQQSSWDQNALQALIPK